ncbi:MAG: biotin-dependent carboxyltransferase family protein [Anaerolineales bacterium]|nr:biotin-dependent carboxyltransferase family protein [Anaerolineales bacterium]NUQ84830.1 biotin-dependent carboxyltransferase [Anaerolineales bacterium]
MSLEILEVNGLATLQDSGRTDWRKFGVPTSGAMDPFAFRAANLLAGNDPHCAAVEIGPGDIAFRALRDCVVSVAGVGFALSIYIWDFPLWSSYYVRGGWTIRLNKLDFGVWAYLAISGGVQTPLVLGSSSTYLRGAFGGLDGRRLQAGDVLRFGIPSRPLPQLAARTLPESARPAYSDHPTIDVVVGPQEKYFTDASIATFMSQPYFVSHTSDRMGYRLEGPALVHRDKVELVSEGMTMGAIQVPANGQPIVMMADSPTTGGYPKIGTVVRADLPLLAQCAPGKSRIRFQRTTVARAQEKARRLMGRLGGSIEAE